MLNDKNKNNYKPPPSYYKRSAWVDALKLIYKVIFAVIVLIGLIIYVKADNAETGLIILCGSLIIAVMTVGFVLVFLEIAGDIREMLDYIYKIGVMIVEDKNKDIAGNIENTAENIGQIKNILKNNTIKKE
ncbi:MAG: hypothetical protein K2J73_12520 [Oscillospiraceae bacterium]|nr:hypothetical protein [Oscillospiraceae bacterium]